MRCLPLAYGSPQKLRKWNYELKATQQSLTAGQFYFFRAANTVCIMRY
jgi:hypothetical protein